MLGLNIWHIFLYLCSCNKSIKHEVVDVVKGIKRRGREVELKVIEKNVKNVTIRLCCWKNEIAINLSTRIDLIEAVGTLNKSLIPAIFLSIQGNWPLIGEIGSLLWEAVAYYQNALLTYLNTSNQILFKVLLFNYLCLCFYVRVLLFNFTVIP